ncbi:hypothetical protein EJ08DRAFT_696499 [Tothia fuscella]|uniref:Uncharacterized protein n=1 Tax=Tothia fuscella TaxID=1048955 RepID=A0A9P4NTZ3_9PEZI|nr:hypothetical protein EJ08DRAFT_696499 [Tothia fuscella]
MAPIKPANQASAVTLQHKKERMNRLRSLFSIEYLRELFHPDCTPNGADRDFLECSGDTLRDLCQIGQQFRRRNITPDAARLKLKRRWTAGTTVTYAQVKEYMNELKDENERLRAMLDQAGGATPAAGSVAATDSTLQDSPAGSADNYPAPAFGGNTSLPSITLTTSSPPPQPRRPRPNLRSFNVDPTITNSFTVNLTLPAPQPSQFAKGDTTLNRYITKPAVQQIQLAPIINHFTAGETKYDGNYLANALATVRQSFQHIQDNSQDAEVVAGVGKMGKVWVDDVLDNYHRHNDELVRTEEEARREVERRKEEQ